MSHIYQWLDYIELALGLGFVIFFHELGHFLAAKYVDVKVEQFAVGFGPAIVAWRKGIGFRTGTTTPDYQKRIEEHWDVQQKDDAKENEKIPPTAETEARIARELGLGETEYRLNWIPLGGYVKMVGQDDMKPGAVADDPRAYNNKAIRSRMLIVSAGVIMNVLLAAIAFAIVFWLGYPVPPTVVGGTISLSPASRAYRADGTRVGLQAGDIIMSINGHDTLNNFSKLQLYTALSHDGVAVPMQVQHRDGTVDTLFVKPSHAGSDSKGLLQIGVKPPSQLQGGESVPEEPWNPDELKRMVPADQLVINPGDQITQIDGKDVVLNDAWKLADALGASDGKPVPITVKSADGKISQRLVQPHLTGSFGKDPLNILGMIPRTRVGVVDEESPAIDKLKPDDVIVEFSAAGDPLDHPSPDQLQERLYAAGDKQLPVTLTVLSAGDTQTHDITGLVPTYRIGNGKRGLGIGLDIDEYHMVVAKTLKDSPTDGKIPAGATITQVNGEPVTNWFQLRQIIAHAKAGDALALTYNAPDKSAATQTFTLTADDINAAQMIAIDDHLMLRQMSSPLKTHNPLTAMQWSVVETRDMILSFYLTLQRMITQDVSPSNLMGPLGMANAGAQVARRGPASLLWFLAMISANLAVVNFLPFPIVDGGLFVMLVLEKIQGKPLSQDIQRIVQIVGLALILGVFLFVTYQDIAKIFRV